jgi:hypothetical protein
MSRLSTTRSRGLLITGGALLLVSTGALAATPDKGEVSHAAPKVTWTGQVTNSYPNRVAILLADQAGESDSVPCAPMSCDTFALKVAESDDLTLTADAPESTSQTGDSGSQVTIRITRPDGSKELHTTEAGGASPDKPLTVKIKKAPAGDWAVEYYNYFYGGAIDYTGTATLGAVKPAAAPPAPAPAPSGGSNPAPSGGSTPAPAAQEGLTVAVKAAKASAKKLKKAKKLAATVTVSRAVKSVSAVLKSGKKVVGKGSAGAFSGSKKITLKLSKKLKKGKYSLTVLADDGAGTKASRTVAVKVAK